MLLLYGIIIWTPNELNWIIDLIWFLFVIIVVESSHQQRKHHIQSRQHVQLTNYKDEVDDSIHFISFYRTYCIVCD